MKKSVKTLSFITILFLFFTNTKAQLQLGISNTISGEVKKVIEDYPNRFANIIGNVIVQNPQTTEYECNFKVNGSEESSITIYSSQKKVICSWQALMLTTESFADAKKKYKTLYNQLNNQAVKTGNLNMLHLNGPYDEPKEEKKFASSILSLNTNDESLKKLRVEISLQYELMEWKVKVLVYDREREDDERGQIKDE